MRHRAEAGGPLQVGADRESPYSLGTGQAPPSNQQSGKAEPREGRWLAAGHPAGERLSRDPAPGLHQPRHCVPSQRKENATPQLQRSLQGEF